MDRRHSLGLLLAALGTPLTGALGGCAGGATQAAPPDPALVRLLAPTGRLRIAVYPGSPSSMVRDRASGEARGVSVDLGRALAARLAVPAELVERRLPAEVVEALVGGQADFTVTNATAARARLVDFTAPVLDLELGYLAPAGSRVKTIADIDQPGVRVGVSQGSSSQAALSREFKRAQLVTAASLAQAIAMLSSSAADAYASNKAVLHEMSDQLAGSRVLDGRWGLEHLGIAIPKGREQALPWVDGFARELKAQGLVARAADRAGLRGIAPR